MKTSVKEWLDHKMSIALGFQTTDIAEYVMTGMTSDAERVEYVRQMLDADHVVEHGRIVDEFKSMLEEEEAAISTTLSSKDVCVSKEMLSESLKKKKKNNSAKFVSLSSKEAAALDRVVLPGRRVCHCQAVKHGLISNCLQCGKVVCEQEGSGPCLFCGALVVTREEREVLNRKSRKSEQLLKRITNAPVIDEAKERAEAHRNTLLDYDRSGLRRTRVIDDQSDYFALDSNQWLSKQQRGKLEKREKEMRDQRFQSKLGPRRIAIDLNNKKATVAEEEEQFYVDDEVVNDLLREEEGNIDSDSQVRNCHKNGIDDVQADVVNPNISVARPLFIETSCSSTTGKTGTSSSTSCRRMAALQDAELQQLRDDGLCLTMHQPYASLLVCGIKKDEGRTWYSKHRGRLWIHAASKEVNQQDVQTIQDFYRRFYNSNEISPILPTKDDIEFPSSYPVSCLLGFVDVVDVLSQEDYADKYNGQGESASPYVFICTNPQELVIKMPMSGQHKICEPFPYALRPMEDKLDTNIHRMAQKTRKQAPVLQ